MSRALYFTLGVVCVALGLVGIVLPLLPTTPFLLLAAFGFARSSPRWHERLRNSRAFGRHLRQWEHDRSIPADAKWRAYILIAVTFGVSIFLVNRLALRILLIVLAAAVITFLAKLKTTVERVD